MAKRKRKNTKKGIKEWGLAFMLALIFSLLIKGFIFQSFIVGSTKMEKTILAGDFIVVNKLLFGPRLPITLLSIPFFASWYSDAIELPYLRIRTKHKIQQNDLIVFNYPDQFELPPDKRDILVKRCVGLPGDTIKIKDKKVYVNGFLLAESHLIQYNYRLVTHGKTLNQIFLDKYDINEGGLVSEVGIYDFPLTNDKLEKVKADELVRYVRELKDFPGENFQVVFPMDKYHSFNKDYFGPLVIPYKGQTLSLSMSNIGIYKAVIEQFEKNTLSIENNKIFINGSETKYYTLKENYYFVLDDNRDNAIDSRYWGFLPESHVIGKTSRVWFSFDKVKGKIRWNRIFKRLN